MAEFNITVAGKQHIDYASTICDEMAESAKARGTGIAKRSPEYIEKQMIAGKAIIAIHKKTKEVAGFCYIESWGHQKYVANSGLIVFPQFRKFGLARKIKEKAFELSRKKFPDAKLFGLTTSLAVMKINSELGYHPVTFSELTDDEQFWKGCQSCINYEILQNKEQKNCLCTGMLYDPQEEKKKKWSFLSKIKVIKRLKNVKELLYLSKKTEK
ncbi:MAG: GNAT family N-acetyltransferase [Cytophagales bacterium]|nr:GNAT family N-acetyltransferase [Cytophagales bacterium]